MKFAHYSPNPWHRLFLDYLEGFEPLINKCDKECEFIWCGSVSCIDKALPAAIKFKIPIITWVWDLPTIFPIHALRTQMYINALKQVTKVVAASRATQEVLKQFGIKSEQMYFYANTTDLKPAKEKKNQIIQVSRFTPHKKFENAIVASFELNVPLLNVGRVNSEEFHYYKYLVDTAGSNSIFYPDLSRPQMIEKLGSSTVLVTSSVFEGWGLSPIEALICDVPVIVSDLPVFREQYGDSVLYHDPNDIDSLTQQLKSVLASEQFQQEIVSKGKERIKEYTPEKFCDRWVDLIQRALC